MRGQTEKGKTIALYERLSHDDGALMMECLSKTKRVFVKGKFTEKPCFLFFSVSSERCYICLIAYI